MNPPYTDWGITHYQDALSMQQTLVQSRINHTIPNTLIFTEHHPVYTLGKRKNTQQNLLWNPVTLKQQNIDLAYTNRGGDITYHGPGQIVAYPIISLEKSKDLHLYLRKLEQVIINTLTHYNLPSTRNPGKTGIWIQNRKIAAIGIAVKQWVTYHGFALNVNTNLAHFSGIIPCGIPTSQASVTSMQNELNLSSNLDLHQIKHTIALEFWNIFNNA